MTGLPEPTEAELREALMRSLDQLRPEDADVLRLDLHEVMLTSRMAHYLATALERHGDPLRVDCEYNRDRADVKTRDDENIRPDVIVHHRNTSKNFLIVECKKPRRGPNGVQAVKGDVERLISMLGAPYRYRHAAYVELAADVCRVAWGREELLALLATLR